MKCSGLSFLGSQLTKFGRIDGPITTSFFSCHYSVLGCIPCHPRDTFVDWPSFNLGELFTSANRLVSISSTIFNALSSEKSSLLKPNILHFSLLPIDLSVPIQVFQLLPLERYDFLTMLFPEN